MPEADTLKLAAFIINQAADSLKDCHTLKGKWAQGRANDDDARAMYRENKALARRLRAIAAGKVVRK